MNAEEFKGSILQQLRGIEPDAITLMLNLNDVDRVREGIYRTSCTLVTSEFGLYIKMELVPSNKLGFVQVQTTFVDVPKGNQDWVALAELDISNKFNALYKPFIEERIEIKDGIIKFYLQPFLFNHTKYVFSKVMNKPVYSLEYNCLTGKWNASNPDSTIALWKNIVRIKSSCDYNYLNYVHTRGQQNRLTDSLMKCSCPQARIDAIVNVFRAHTPHYMSTVMTEIALALINLDSSK